MNRLSNLIPPGRRLLCHENGPQLFNLTNRSSSSSSSSAKLKTLPVPAVCLSKDGSTFLAYHPQRDFPYEHSSPIPNKTAEDNAIEEGDATSPLNVRIMREFKEKADSKKLTEKDLEKMFGECKAFFRPQPQERSRADDAEYRKMMKQKSLNELPEK